MKFYFPLVPLLAILMFACKKEDDKPDVNLTDKLALGSLVATKKHIVTREETIYLISCITT